MKKLFPLFILPLLLLNLDSHRLRSVTTARLPTLSGEGDWDTPFEKSEYKSSATYEECIAYYKALDDASTKLKVIEYAGGTDIGKPLHLVVISGDENFSAAAVKRTDRRIVLINNGIHPGEPDGIDASMMLARDLILEKAYAPLLEHIVVCIIPIYNVDGSLIRGCCSRANQNGPDAYGFRGNAKNLDLNRDFAKADSKNAITFSKIFQEWGPDVFVDTHVSDGADYQYVMTYIATQKDKLHPSLSTYMKQQMVPSLEQMMKEAEYEMCPYVNTLKWTNPPDSGIMGFLETPRYATGYSTLFNTIGFTTESHMLKSFEDRTWATYEFLLALTKIVNRDRVFIARAKKEADDAIKTQTDFPLNWQWNPKGLSGKINFKGYSVAHTKSEVTGLDRMYYDRNAPFTKEISFMNEFTPQNIVKKPVAYIIPQAWTNVIERFTANGVEMKKLEGDQEVEVEVYYIDSTKTSKDPYEGHYVHSKTKVRKEMQKIMFHAGDYVVYTNQTRNRYVVEMLEPEGDDSFFNWNFFDEILQQKEYFSSYIFEETAAKLITEHPEWKTELETKKAQDTLFAKTPYLQLEFIYKKTNGYEKSHNRYPVGRMIKDAKLNLAK